MQDPEAYNDRAIAAQDAAIVSLGDGGSQGRTASSHQLARVPLPKYLWRGGSEGVNLNATVTTQHQQLQVQRGRRGQHCKPRLCIDNLPNEVLYRILEFLEVNDLLSASRISHLFRHLSRTPILTVYRLRAVRKNLPPLLSSPYRPTLRDLIAKSIFMTNTSVVSRRLGRSLASIRLARQLASRPPPEVLVERSLMPRECVPGLTPVPLSPSIVAKKRAIERELVKDVLRHWVGTVWTGKARTKADDIQALEEQSGIGKVWRLIRFWEQIASKGGLIR
ncbi:uncharacterized protein BROUX77_005130 [Berkeleyomyces rouxiae]|uniref:uncharacterized protein n=1 Tax=Berkeleyomyces rouxiae TaxID=2035830 RepID=UPI003B779262